MPKPTKGESEKDFVARCMAIKDKEGKFDMSDEKQRKQAVAICYSQYKQGLKENKEVIPFTTILRG